MYVGAGSVSDLVDWFNSSAQENLLCLFVSRNLEDEELLAGLFDSRAIVSQRLGPSLALCFFSSSATLREINTRDPRHGDYLFVPGLIDTRIDGPRSLIREGWECIEPAVVEKVPNSVRQEVLLRTEAVAEEIVRHFELDDDSPPCLIFVTRDDPIPFVVPTHSAADVKAVLALFDDLRTITAALVTFEGWSLPKKAARREVLVRELADLGNQLSNKTEKATTALAAAASAAESYGLSQVIIDVGPDRAHDLYRHLGLSRAGQQTISVSADTAAAARSAAADRQVSTAFHKVITAGELRTKTVNAINKRESELKQIDADLAEETLKTRFRTVEDEVEAVCARYDRKFKRAKRYMALRKFVRILTGVAKVAEKVTTSAATTADEFAKAMDHR
jgi:hypothetical protein